MPRSHRNVERELAVQALAALPRRLDFVLEGGKRSLGAEMRAGVRVAGRIVAAWVATDTGEVRASAIISPTTSVDNGVSETVDALMVALAMPSLVVDAGAGPRANGHAGGEKAAPTLDVYLPARIRVTDEGLAAEVRALLRPLDIAVDYSDDTPFFDGAFQLLAREIGGSPADPLSEPFDWAIDPALLPPLYKAASAYARHACYHYIPEREPVVVTLGADNGPRPGVEEVYAVRWSTAQAYILAFYYAPDIAERWQHRRARVLAAIEEQRAEQDRLWRANATPTVRSLLDLQNFAERSLQDLGEVENEVRGVLDEALVFYLYSEVNFFGEANLDPAYLSWLRARGLRYLSPRKAPVFHHVDDGGATRQPDEREARALRLSIAALTGFVRRHQKALDRYSHHFRGDPAREGLSHVSRIATGAGVEVITVGYEPSDPFQHPGRTPQAACRLRGHKNRAESRRPRDTTLSHAPCTLVLKESGIGSGECMLRLIVVDKGTGKRKRAQARQLERALKIVSLVSVAPYQYTRPRLATDFEVSERTIDRALALLRGLGYEIDHDPERGYAFARTPPLPPAPLTLPDVLALTLAAELARDSGDIDTASLGAALARLLDAVPLSARPLLRRELLRRAESKRAGAGRRAALRAVQQALLEGRRARIVYATGSRGGEISERVIEPYLSVVPCLCCRHSANVDLGRGAVAQFQSSPGSTTGCNAGRARCRVAVL